MPSRDDVGGRNFSEGQVSQFVCGRQCCILLKSRGTRILANDNWQQYALRPLSRPFLAGKKASSFIACPCPSSQVLHG